MTSWWSRLLERRRARHVSPWPVEHMDRFRCRVWHLIRAGKS